MTKYGPPPLLLLMMIGRRDPCTPPRWAVSPSISSFISTWRRARDQAAYALAYTPFLYAKAYEAILYGGLPGVAVTAAALRTGLFDGPVIAIFDNLLPDNEQIRRRLAERVRAGGAARRRSTTSLSAQPNVHAGEIRHNRMKLAMAVGNSRHYTIELHNAAAFPADGGKRRRSRFSRARDPGRDRKRYGSRHWRCNERSALGISGTDRFISQ
jgi:hypothetical protein